LDLGCAEETGCCPAEEMREIIVIRGEEKRGGVLAAALSALSGKKGPGSIPACVYGMLRCPRIHLDGVPLHIVQRGHNRGPCFFDEQDRHAYLSWLGDALRREQRALHAYVLMTNHIHLLVAPTEQRRSLDSSSSLGAATFTM
jgi:putative transposase